MARYVEVPSAALFELLAGCGFERDPLARGTEVVYGRRVQLDRLREWGPKGELTARVYTSVREGAGSARGRGADAIRVTLSWADGERSCGLYSERVLRAGTVEGVLERTKLRMREAWKLGATMRRCPRCGGPAWPDSGRCAPRCQAASWDAALGVEGKWQP